MLATINGSINVSLWAMYQNVPKAMSPSECIPSRTPLEKNAKSNALTHPTFLFHKELAKRKIRNVVSIDTKVSVMGIAAMDIPNILNIRA